MQTKQTANERKERPIIFGAESVKAILDGRKTMTRRIVKPRKNDGELVALFDDEQLTTKGFAKFDTTIWHAAWIDCPYGKVGDLLWVREAWTENHMLLDNKYSYRADSKIPEIRKWKPSIHMPRWASRITLKITNIRVERIQDISDDGAKAEGVEKRESEFGDDDWSDSIDCPEPIWTYRNGFKSAWIEINGADSWKRNDWVWVIEFKNVCQNERV